jgi:hypothetical protein
MTHILAKLLSPILVSLNYFQNVMTFNKCSINAKAMGDTVDEYGNPLDITEVCIRKTEAKLSRALPTA